MPALAIDIGTYSVKAVAGKPGKNPIISRSIESFNKLGIAVPTDDAHMESMIEMIGNMVSDNKLVLNDVRLSLPESVVSTKLISIPNLSDAELASAIDWQAEQHIPIPKEELALEYKVIFRPARQDKQTPMRVLLVGTRKTVVERYTELFINLGVEPTILETQTLSLLRNLQMTPEEPTTLVAHLGASTMNMAIFHQGELQFVSTYPAGGHLLTKALQQIIGLDIEQAEEYKRSYGLNPDQFEGKVRNALLPTTQSFIGEMQKATNYFSTQRPKEAVRRIVMSGGTSQLPGLVEHVASTFGLEVLLAAPFASAKGEVPTSNQQAMAVCMGLIMREN
ncbi:MAG: type IV pilus assembly protein PilM [Patescibacteria group bacterium]